MFSRGASIALGVLVLAGCKPGVGSACQKGDARCLDAARALVCESGHFVETPCRGKDGCSTKLEVTACDIHGNQPGDACSTDEEGSAVCAGPNAMLACHGGKYVSVACRGGRGCAEEGGRAECDESVAESGERCVFDGKKACSADGKHLLVCAAGQNEARYECRGEHGCSIVRGKIDCDVSVARSGDACDPAFEGTFSCTEDALAIVRCSGGHFVRDENCRRGTRCLAEPGSTRCAKPDKT